MDQHTLRTRSRSHLARTQTLKHTHVKHTSRGFSGRTSGQRCGVCKPSLRSRASHALRPLMTCLSSCLASNAPRCRARNALRISVACVAHGVHAIERGRQRRVWPTVGRRERRGKEGSQRWNRKQGQLMRARLQQDDAKCMRAKTFCHPGLSRERALHNLTQTTSPCWRWNASSASRCTSSSFPRPARDPPRTCMLTGAAGPAASLPTPWPSLKPILASILNPILLRDHCRS